jgi:hypothetical protein
MLGRSTVIDLDLMSHARVFSFTSSPLLFHRRWCWAAEQDPDRINPLECIRRNPAGPAGARFTAGAKRDL